MSNLLDLINNPTTVNDEDIKNNTNDVIVNEQNTSSNLDILNSPIQLNVSENTDNTVTTNIPEENEIKKDAEEKLPPSQDSLYELYQNKYPELFKDGKLIDVDTAQEIGIISNPILVPISDDLPNQGVIYGHSSTKVDDKDRGFRYNIESDAVDIQKKSLNEDKFFTRVANLDDKEDLFEGLSEAEELEEINNIIKEMPEKNPNGSINLTKKFFELTGPTGFRFILGVGKAVDYTGAYYTDTIENMASAVQQIFPDAYNVMTSTANRARGNAFKPINPKDLAKEVGKGTGALFEFAETIPLLGQTQRLFYSLPKANEKIAKKLAIKAEKNKKAAEKYWKRTLNVSKMRGATAAQIKEKKDAAKKVAEENKEVATELIDAFETKTGSTISKTDKDGNKTLDGNLARSVGKEKTKDLAQLTKDKSEMTFLEKVELEARGGEGFVDKDAVVFGQGETLTESILKPEKFDAIVATASELKKRNPKVFDNNKTIIDNLFDLTVKKQLIGGDELIDILNKYDLSFEDYVLTIVGSGSTAGQILNKLSQIKRARPVNEMVALQQKATINAQEGIRNAIMRIENIRRGGLVSQIATAARNLSSATIRAPLEGLGNVVDNVLYQVGKGDYLEAVKGISPIRVKAPEFSKIGDKSFFEAFRDGSPLGFTNNWKDSFRHMKYMFDNPRETKEVVDFILERPELEGQFKLLFDNVNEIMISTGRGKGGVLDKILSEGEDAVMALNIPNRWQEFLVRRGAFLGELERLVKREYKIDFMEALADGKIRDLLNDAGNVRPPNARSFIDLVADSTQKALDVTYAKQPDIKMFRNITSFIVRNGLTVVAPFPRFMFNSMELMGQYMGGASIPLTRKIVGIVNPKVRGTLTAKDRQRISRNLIGAATLFAAYQYRDSEDAPPDYKKLRVDDGTEMDTTPQFPMRQFLYLAEFYRRYREGTLQDFFDPKELVETFAGTNVRVGVGQSIFQDIAEIIQSTDVSAEQKSAEGISNILAEYLSSWFVPFGQMVEAQRALGVRGTEYKDLREDPTLDASDSAEKALRKPLRTRGLLVSPEEEEKAPKREFVFADKKERVSPASRVLLGLNFSTRDNEDGEYLAKLGFKDYKFGSKSAVPSIQRAENKIIRMIIPMVVENAKFLEKKYKTEWENAKEDSVIRKKYPTAQAFSNSFVISYIKQRMRKEKKKIATKGLGKMQSTEYARQLTQFRRLGSDLRRLAIAEFYRRFNEEPVLSEARDIKRLNLIAKGDPDAGTTGFKQIFQGTR